MREYIHYKYLKGKYIYGYLREFDDQNGPAGSLYYVGQGTNARIVVSHGTVPVPKNKKMIVVFEDDISDQDYADEIEKELIKLHGRIILGTGILQNVYSGGSGFGATGMVAVKDANGNSFMVKTTDKRYLSGELIHATKGIRRNVGYLTAKDKNGNTLRVHNSDERLKTGELVHHGSGVSVNIGMVVVKDEKGNTFRVHKDDPRLKSGEVTGIMKNSISSKKDNTVYCFENVNSGDKVYMTQSDFTKKYNIHSGSANRLVNSKVKIAQGWKLSK